MGLELRSRPASGDSGFMGVGAKIKTIMETPRQSGVEGPLGSVQQAFETRGSSPLQRARAIVQSARHSKANRPYALRLMISVRRIPHRAAARAASTHQTICWPLYRLTQLSSVAMIVTQLHNEIDCVLVRASLRRRQRLERMVRKADQNRIPWLARIEIAQCE